MQVPSHIAEEIKRFDPRLRLRWSKERKCFVLEEKVKYRNILFRPIKFFQKPDGSFGEKMLPENSERYIQFKDGYSTLRYILPEQLDRRVMWWLYFSDWYRAGKAFIKNMELQEEEKMKQKEAKGYDELDQVSSAAHDHLQYAHGEKMSMAS